MSMGVYVEVGFHSSDDMLTSVRLFLSPCNITMYCCESPHPSKDSIPPAVVACLVLRSCRFHGIAVKPPLQLPASQRRVPPEAGGPSTEGPLVRHQTDPDYLYRINQILSR